MTKQEKAIRRFYNRELHIERISLAALLRKTSKEFAGISRKEIFVECFPGAPNLGDCFFVTVGNRRRNYSSI